MKSPFKFLNAFTAADRGTFFGREQELAMLHQMLHKTPLLLLYGLSGTGKTSLIQCGLASRFDGPDWLPLWVKRQSDLNESLDSGIAKLLPPEQTGTIADKVRFLYRQYLRPVYLIFDQLEELFVLGSADEQKHFAQTLRDLIQVGMPCTVLLVIREEYLGRLYPLEREIPTLFDYRVRMEPMNAHKVKGVLEKSFRAFNITVEAPAGERYQEIIRNISKGRSGIDLPYLQIYLDLLYRESYARMEKKGAFIPHDREMPALMFTRVQIQQFGDIDTVLDRFRAEQEGSIRQALQKTFPGSPDESLHLILDAFVSEEGTKRPLPYTRMGGYIVPVEASSNLLPDLPPPVLTFCLESLEHSRLIRLEEKTMELAHDSLAVLINQRRSEDQRRRNVVKRSIENAYKEWNEKRGGFLTRKQIKVFDMQTPPLVVMPYVKDYIEKSRRWRLKMLWLRRGIVLAIATLSIALFVLGYQIRQKNKVANLTAQARLEAGTDPTIALQTLHEAMRISPNDPAVREVYGEIYSNNEFYFKSLEHTDAVKGVFFVPASDSVANAPGLQPDIISWTDQTLYRWRGSGELQDSLFVDKLTAVALSPDGRLLAVGTQEGNLHMLSANTLKKIQPETTIQYPDGNITHLAFSNDGEILIAAGRDSLICILKTNSISEPRKKIHVGGEVSALAWGPGTDTLLIGYATGQIQMYDQRQSAFYFLQQRHIDRVLSFAVSPDKKTWVSAGRDALLNYWDKHGQPVLTIKGHDRRINQVVWSPDGSRLFSAGDDYRVKCWSPEGDFITSYKGHTSFVNAVAISPDGQYLASAGDDKILRLWRVESKVIRRFGPHLNGVSSIAVSKDGEWVLTGSDEGRYKNNPEPYLKTPPAPRSAYLWDATTGFLAVELKGHLAGVNAVAINPEGTFLITASDDSTVIGWNQRGDPITDFSSDHYGKISSVAMSADGHYILTGGYDDGLVTLWDSNRIKLISLQHQYYVTSVAFSGDGSKFITGCLDGTTRMFDLKGIQLDSFTQGSIHWLMSVSFSPDGQYIVVGEGQGKNVWMYPVKNKKKKEVAKIAIASENNARDNYIHSVDFSPDSRYVCVGATYGLAQIFQITEKGLIPFLTLQHYPRRSILSVRFTADGKGILTGSGDGWGRWWKIDL